MQISDNITFRRKPCRSQCTTIGAKHIAIAIAFRRLNIGQNYILLVDMTNQLHDEGKGIDEAL